MTTPDSKQQLSVSQLNRLAKQLLEDCFAEVAVTGEISTLSRPSSGHWYFTLKDQQAQIRCAFFRNRNMRVNFRPEAGQQVIVHGKVSLYEGRGDYQLIVDAMQPAGAGALAAAFEALKEELKAAGWFDADHKKPLPEQIHHLAVITSPTGAALQDIRSVLERRWPMMRLTVLPVLVQGEQAAAQISRAIEQANYLAASGREDFGAVLLTRGGGSLEDLWPFNERNVATAVYHSQLPVISAVGHEVDFSISDFVADVRAATPSAAAELLSPDQMEILSRLNLLRGRLAAAQQRRLRQQQETLASLLKRIRSPQSRLREQAQRLDELELRLQRQQKLLLRQKQQTLHAARQRLVLLNPQQTLKRQRLELQQLGKSLRRSIEQRLQQQQRQLEHCQRQLRALGPEQTLSRGYAIVLNPETGKAVRNSEELTMGHAVDARFAAGRAMLRVEQIEGSVPGDRPLQGD